MAEEKKYSIAEIRHYMTGGMLATDSDPTGIYMKDNFALMCLVSELESPEDGIEAVTKRAR